MAQHGWWRLLALGLALGLLPGCARRPEVVASTSRPPAGACLDRLRSADPTLAFVLAPGLTASDDSGAAPALARDPCRVQVIAIGPAHGTLRRLGQSTVTLQPVALLPPLPKSPDPSADDDEADADEDAGQDVLSSSLLGLALRGLQAGIDAVRGPPPASAAPAPARTAGQSASVLVDEVRVQQRVRLQLTLTDAQGSPSAPLLLQHRDERTLQVPAQQGVAAAIAVDGKPQLTLAGRRFHSPAGLLTSAQMAELVQAPLSLDLGRVRAEAATMAGGPPVGAGRRTTASDVTREPAAPSAAAPPPADGRVVLRVTGLRGAGQGVYVATNRLLTAAMVAEGSSLVGVEEAGGLVTHGVVERLDDATGLALVYLARPGRALGLADGSADPPVSLAALPGMPLLEAGRLVGMVVDPARARVASGQAIAAWLAPSELAPDATADGVAR